MIMLKWGMMLENMESDIKMHENETGGIHCCKIVTITFSIQFLFWCNIWNFTTFNENIGKLVVGVVCTSFDCVWNEMRSFATTQVIFTLFKAKIHVE